MGKVITRKYRGAQRIAEIRQRAAVESEGYCASALREAGFAHLAAEQQRREDETLARENAEWLAQQRPQYQARLTQQRAVPKRLRSRREPRDNLRMKTPEENSRWPWARVRRGVYVLTKAWRHLAGKLPNIYEHIPFPQGPEPFNERWERHRAMTEARYKLHEKIVREELLRRDLMAKEK
jgi:hypothetical protein